MDFIYRELFDNADQSVSEALRNFILIVIAYNDPSASNPMLTIVYGATYTKYRPHILVYMMNDEVLRIGDRALGIDLDIRASKLLSLDHFVLIGLEKLAIY